MHDIAQPRIARDAHHDVLIVIPTIATPRVLVPAFARLLQHLDGLRVHVVLSINPKLEADGKRSQADCLRLWDSMVPEDKGCTLTVYNHGQLAGFGGAINLGLHAVLNTRAGMQYRTSRSPVGGPQPLADQKCATGDGTEAWGVPPLTVIYNDDLVATKGWLDGLLRALESEVVYEWSELAKQDPDTLMWSRPQRRMADYGRVGLVGPASNCAAGIQQIDGTKEDLDALGWDGFAAHWRAKAACTVLTATFLSGFCLGITDECLEALAAYTVEGTAAEIRFRHTGEVEVDVQPGSVGQPRFAWLFDERYVVAGYEDNDLAMRADVAGFRAIVAGDTFMGHLGHQSFDSAFPDWQRGMRNRLVHYDKWRPHVQAAGRKLVAAFRVRFDVPHDLGLFRLAVRRIAALADGVVVLLTRNPAAMMDSGEYAQAMREGEVPESDQQLLRLCAAEPDKAHEYLGRWVAQVLNKADDSRMTGARAWAGENARQHLDVQSWPGEFNEREERNHMLGMAEGLGADWVFSVDHDELVEPRVTRHHLERLMLHPDPMVQQWDIAFTNHWIDTRMYRIDRPWGDGGTWTGGMRGFRLYRVNKVAPRRILAGGHAGLHCGNVPGVDGLAKRVAGVRIRHLGYVRVEDRYRKEKRYNVQDPNPDPMLVGGTSYAHITQDEGMELSPFVQQNGIGLHLLMYERENADDLGRLLDQLYGVVDRIVLVWTGAWAPGDKDWLISAPDGEPRDAYTPWLWGDLASSDQWPATGPSQAVARMAAHFGAEWLHHPLEDHLGAARNAGIQALHGTPGMGWALFFDPDEQLPQQAPVYLRRMAEAAGCWGWMFRFKNMFDNGGGNQSESVRLSRLDPDGRMRMHGRVHESFSRAVRQLVDDGYGQVLRVAPFITMNTGLAHDPDTIQAKLEFYRRLTEQQLREDPRDPLPWVTMGLYWMNEGCTATAGECFARATLVADKEYLPFQEMALHLLRQARHFMAEAVQRMEGHSMQRPNAAIVDFIDKAAPEVRQLGTVVEGQPRYTEEEAMATLPPLPALPAPE